MSAGQNRQPLPYQPWKHPSVSQPWWIFNMPEELKILMEWKQSSEMFKRTCLKIRYNTCLLKRISGKNEVRKKNWEITDALWFCGFCHLGLLCVPACPLFQGMTQWNKQTKKKMWFQTKQNGNKATYLTTFNIFHVQTPLIKACQSASPIEAAHNQHPREYCASGHVTPHHY